MPARRLALLLSVLALAPTPAAAQEAVPVAPPQPPPPQPPQPQPSPPQPRAATWPTGPIPLDTYPTARAVADRSGLDLDDAWEEYARRAPRDQRFIDFARAKFRRKMFTGIGLSLGGLVLVGLGTALVLVASERLATDSEAEIDVTGGALVILGGAALGIPGAILWPVNQVRLHKLRRADAPQANRPHLRPLALPRGAGLGLSLAF